MPSCSPKISQPLRTVRIVRQLFPMFPLSVDGVTDAVQALVGARN